MCFLDYKIYQIININFLFSKIVDNIFNHSQYYHSFYLLRHNEILGNNIRYKTAEGEIIVYGHLSSFKAKIGDIVHKGDIIGMSGGDPKIQPSGRSSGSHLHLSVYSTNGILVDPAPYVLNQVQHNNSSPFLFSVMLILLFIVLWKFRRLFIYSIAILLIILIIFIVS